MWADPRIETNLLYRVLEALRVDRFPKPEIENLGHLYAAFVLAVPFDNIQMRAHLADGSAEPRMAGADPSEFFEQWLAHGTGGICWPINGALCSLLTSVGFNARRIAGSMIRLGTFPNHGSLAVNLAGQDYLLDVNMGALEPLPLLGDAPTNTGCGIHDIRATPTEHGHDVTWYTGLNREEPLVFRTSRKFDPVDHPFFFACYGHSIQDPLFRHSLYISKRFPDKILSIGRNKKFVVATDGALTVTRLDDPERASVLVEEFGISEEMVGAIPSDKIPDATE